MTFIQYIYELKKLFREIEKLNIKCVHLKCACEFNQTCLSNLIFPKFLQISIFYKYQNLYFFYFFTNIDVIREGVCMDVCPSVGSWN